ncbi:MAG: hypothetical protein ACE5I3_00915 [Phycisphaerae bacterium]
MASADKERLGADLSAYLDGELSPERAREVERLLAESEQARRTLADLRAISQSLGDLPRRRAPAGLPDKVRRSVERQVLLQERAPAGRPRVLKLVARISASAALIAACVFAGWTVLQRVNRPAPRGVEGEIAAGEALAGGDEDAKAFARRFPPAVSAETEAAATAAAEPHADAPAIAMAKKRESLGYKARAGEVPAAGAAIVATKDEIVAAEKDDLAAAATPIVAVTPAVNILVSPRDANEYNASLRTVALWQQAPRSMVGRVAAGLVTELRPGRGRMSGAAAEAKQEEASAAPTQQDFTLRVQPDQVGDMLLALERDAPQQVRVEMRFNVSDFSQVQRMVMPVGSVPPDGELTVAEARPTPVESARPVGGKEVPARKGGLVPSGPDVLEARRHAGRESPRGRVVRSPPRAKMGVPEEAAEAEESIPLDAFRSLETLDADAIQPLQSLGYAGGLEEADEAESKSPAGEKKASAGQRHPRVEDVAAGVSARLAPPAAWEELGAEEEGPTDGDAARTARLPAAALAIRDHAIEIRERLGGIYEIMLDAARHADRAKKRPEPTSTPVTLRVTLLPPPAAQPKVQLVPSPRRGETP